MRISDWSSDVCSSDLFGALPLDLGSSPQHCVLNGPAAAATAIHLSMVCGNTTPHKNPAHHGSHGPRCRMRELRRLRAHINLDKTVCPLPQQICWPRYSLSSC